MWAGFGWVGSGLVGWGLCLCATAGHRVLWVGRHMPGNLLLDHGVGRWGWLGGWASGMGGVCVVWCGVCRQESVWRLEKCDTFLLFPSELEVAHKRHCWSLYAAEALFLAAYGGGGGGLSDLPRSEGPVLSSLAAARVGCGRARQRSMKW